MNNIIKQFIGEIQALGVWCIIHGPEIWIGISVLCILSIGLILGMWLAALLDANKDKDSDKKN